MLDECRREGERERIDGSGGAGTDGAMVESQKKFEEREGKDRQNAVRAESEDKIRRGR